jgi:uncharacterized protein (DUF697 family)
MPPLPPQSTKVKSMQKNTAPEDLKAHESTEDETIEDAADENIKYHVYGALAMGLMPLPLIDFLGISAIQLNLLKNLSELYEVPFSKDMVKNLVGALIGATLPSMYLSSVSKLMPVIGQSVGLISSSAIAGVSTYAIGKVFNRHFSEGGTFLSFDPEKARAFYEQMFQEGQQLVSEHQKTQK